MLTLRGTGEEVLENAIERCIEAENFGLARDDGVTTECDEEVAHQDEGLKPEYVTFWRSSQDLAQEIVEQRELYKHDLEEAQAAVFVDVAEQADGSEFVRPVWARLSKQVKKLTMGRGAAMTETPRYAELERI